MPGNENNALNEYLSTRRRLIRSLLPKVESGISESGEILIRINKQRRLIKKEYSRTLSDIKAERLKRKDFEKALQKAEKKTKKGKTESSSGLFEQLKRDIDNAKSVEKDIERALEEELGAEGNEKKYLNRAENEANELSSSWKQAKEKLAVLMRTGSTKEGIAGSMSVNHEIAYIMGDITRRSKAINSYEMGEEKIQSIMKNKIEANLRGLAQKIEGISQQVEKIKKSSKK